MNQFREKSASYILGVYRAGIDSGILAPTTFDKMAQQADIASAATQDEMLQIGSTITAQDISSLAKILSVLTQLQQMYQDQSMMEDPAMMQQPMMQQPMMQQPMMQQPMGPPPGPMGPPPQGMMAPGPGPAVQ